MLQEQLKKRQKKTNKQKKEVEYSTIKKNEIMPFEATWMELETLIQSEVSQKDKVSF